MRISDCSSVVFSFDFLTYRSCSEASHPPSSTTVPVLHVKAADAGPVTNSDPSRFDDEWHDRLRALVDDRSVSLREIGRRLGADPRTVQRRARKIGAWRPEWTRSEEQTSELQSLMRISYAASCLK